MESYPLVHRPHPQSKRNRKTPRRARRATRGKAMWFSWCKILQPRAFWPNRFCGAVAVALRATRCAAVYKSARRFAQRSGYKKNQRVTRLELATSSLARRCSTTELHPQFTYENRPKEAAENCLVRLFYPAYARDQMRTDENASGF